MNKFLKGLSIFIVSASMVLAMPSYAKRMGGGKSIGRQNTTAIQRAQDPSNAPAMQQYRPQQQNQYGQQPQKQPSRFGGFAALAGGIAAGLGLSWLASKMGFGAEFGNIMFILLLVVIGVAIFRMMKKRATKTNYSDNYAYNNANNTSYDANNYSNNTSSYNTSNSYSPNTNYPQQDYNNYSQNQYNQTQNSMYPPEINALVSQANFWFTNIQSLSDQRNINELRRLLSSELLAHIEEDFRNSGTMSKTITQDLQSNLLDWRETNFEWLATIQYRAMVSEDGNPYAPINEAWTFTKDKTKNEDWKLDGISQLNS